MVGGAICTSPRFHVREKDRLDNHAWAFHCLHLEVTDVHSTHISLARTSHSFTGRGWETKGSEWSIWGDLLLLSHPLVSYVSVGELLTLSVSQFLHLLTENYNCSFLLGQRQDSINFNMQVSQKSGWHIEIA